VESSQTRINSGGKGIWLIFRWFAEEARNGSDDIRFSDYYCTLQAVVTSSAQSDSGVFENESQEIRLRPFERAGVA
jgi:hypothetical protein